MARLARVVLPGHPHHITQRGNRCQDVFFTGRDSDVEDEKIYAGQVFLEEGFSTDLLGS